MVERSMLSQEEIDALLKATDGVPEAAGDSGPPEAPVEVPGLEAEAPAVTEAEVAAGAETGTTATAEAEAGAAAEEKTYRPAPDLTQAEKDALGEIGNISMGSAATTLSELLRQRVTITSPKVTTCWQEELFATFQVPYILIQVDFKLGLEGFNVLIIKAGDAALIADLMMGGDGTKPSGEISELELSAASEAMNQMIGTASTSLSTIFGRTISISPPQATILEVFAGAKDYRLPTADPIVVVSFQMKVGELLDTELMQIMSIQTAREEAGLLLAQVAGIAAPGPAIPAGPAGPEAEEVPSGQEKVSGSGPAAFAAPVTPAAPAGKAAAGPVREEAAALAAGRKEVPFPAPAAAATPSPVSAAAAAAAQAIPFPAAQAAPAVSILSETEQRRLELLLDIPLKVSVILGRTKRPIKEVLSLTPGAIVELSSQVNEPVEILVNGTLIARGEVVAVNENFGVRITDIISPRERIQQLGGER